MKLLPRTCRCLLFSAGGAVASATALWAQTFDPVGLAPLVTTATRVPESSAIIGTSLTTLSGADAVRQQLTSLADELWQSPGGPLFGTGRAGASTSLFLRGANSDQVLFLVDGSRFSDANANYGPFLGSWRPGATDQVEIARGPQSMLYGADAAGGVVSLSTPAGSVAPIQSIELEGGSFGTVQGTAELQGSLKGWTYNASLSGGETDNGRTNNQFRSANAVIRIDRRLTRTLAVGATLRGLDATYGDPGDIYTNNPYDHEKEQDLLGTFFATDQFGDNFSGKLTLGGHYRRFVSYEPGFAEQARDLRGVADGQITGRLTEHNHVTAGFDLETGQASDNGFEAIDHHDELLGLFVQDEFSPFENIYVTAGVRHDHYSSYGAADTGRTTLAWLGHSHFVKLRGSYGTGFNSPSFLDLYARSPSFVGNPQVKPSRSKGWDAGFDFYLPEDPSQVLSVTWFHTDYHNLIEDNFAATPATTYNAGKARTAGLEVGWKTHLAGAIQTKIAYTYLLATNRADGTRLLRRPRNSGSADLFLDLKNGWTVGAGGLYVSSRPDLDAQTFAAVQDPSYSAVRMYVHYQYNTRLGLHARVENGFDRVYSPINGYPARRRGYFGGVDYKF
jgi:vitamin B12 transporter